MVKRVHLEHFATELKEYNHVALQSQQAAVANAITHAVPLLVASSPVDTGLYAQSWDFTIDEHSAVLGNYAPYAPIIEFGARPFTPPLGPLLAWAKRVLQDPSQPPDYSSRVWALALGTRNKIAEYGMKPQHILENAIPAIIEEVKRELEKLV
jgi:hypothetical protein